MIGQIGDRALGIGKAEVLERTAKEAEGLQEEEFIGGGAVEVDTTQPGRADVGQIVVFTRVAISGIPLLEIMYYSIVVFCIDNSTETRLQNPLELPNGIVLFVLEPSRVASPGGTIACAVSI